jgi:hypothetical protein
MNIVLPLPPNMANSRRHWRVTLKEKKAYWQALDAIRHTWPRPTKPHRASISAHLYVWNWMDDEGALARLKWAIDYLVAWDYLADDSRKHMTWEGMPGQTIDRKNPRVEITITAIEQEAA